MAIGASTVIAASHVGTEDNPQFEEWAKQVAQAKGDNPSTVQRAKDAINWAIREYQMYLWPFERILTTFVLANADPDYELNHRVKGTFRCMLRNPGNTKDALAYTWADPVTFEAGQGLADKIYTIKNGNRDALLTLAPTPDATLAGRTISVGTYQSSATLSIPEAKFQGPASYVSVLHEKARYKFLRDDKSSNQIQVQDARAESERQLSRYIAATQIESDDPNRVTVVPS